MRLKLRKIEQLIYGDYEFILARLVRVDRWKADIDLSPAEVKNHSDLTMGCTVSSPLDEHFSWSNKHAEVNAFSTKLL